MCKQKQKHVEVCESALRVYFLEYWRADTGIPNIFSKFHFCTLFWLNCLIFCLFSVCREVKRDHPDILFGKSCQELPVHGIASLSQEILAAHTGPKGGLTRVNRAGHHVKADDPEISFIDEDMPLKKIDISEVIKLAETNGYTSDNEMNGSGSDKGIYHINNAKWY